MQELEAVIAEFVDTYKFPESLKWSSVVRLSQDGTRDDEMRKLELEPEYKDIKDILGHLKPDDWVSISKDVTKFNDKIPYPEHSLEDLRQKHIEKYLSSCSFDYDICVTLNTNDGEKEDTLPIITSQSGGLPDGEE